MLWFMDATKDWLWRVHAVGADGYFKMAIRRRTEADDIWSWALEWNQNMRLVGFFGRGSLVEELETSIPTLELETAIDKPDEKLHFRTEVALSVADDVLFVCPDDPDLSQIDETLP